jgi:hypothetical protein
VAAGSEASCDLAVLALAMLPESAFRLLDSVLRLLVCDEAMTDAVGSSN